MYPEILVQGFLRAYSGERDDALMHLRVGKNLEK